MRFFLIAALILASCATVLPPPGGPEDKLPPRVSGISLAPNSTMQSTDLNITLQFDEWIVQKPPNGAVAISPPIAGRLRLKADGNLLKIYSNEPLDSNTTYTLTITNAIKDLRDNPLEKPFQLLFSTGDFLDSLSGDFLVMLQDSLIKKKKFPVVAFYPVGNARAHKGYLEKFRDSSITAEQDTLPRITKEIPQYIAQTDSLGNATLQGMQAGDYWAIAFLDENNNQRLDLESEIAGIAPFPLILKPSITDTLPILFSLGDLDTSSISLDGVSQRGNAEIELSFSRALAFDSLFLKNNCGFTSSGTSSDTLFPTNYYQDQSSKNPVLVVQGLANDTLYNVSCKYARDSLGRNLSKTLNSAKFRFKKIDEKDIVPTAISRIEPSKGASDILPSQEIKITYNHPILLDTLLGKFRLYINEDSVNFEMRQTDAARLEIMPFWGADSKVKLAFVEQDSVIDTLFTEKILAQFGTISKLKLASVKGKIPDGNSQTIIIFQEILTRKAGKSTTKNLGKEFKAKCDESGNFEISGIAEGTYKIFYFKDSNGDGMLTSGSVFPLQAGEDWSIAADEITVPHGENKFPLESSAGSP